ncbi:stalk domain-containing protein [Saccharibacillus sp. O23]|nr:stalk domain-containing protein [Saccharibacillus sp. O23]
MEHKTVVAQNGEILIPLRDAVSALGKQIVWDRESGKITVIGRIAY